MTRITLNSLLRPAWVLIAVLATLPAIAAAPQQGSAPAPTPSASAAAAPSSVSFSWGAEIGSTVDLSGHDMTSLDFSAYFGIRRSWLDFAGVGAAANVVVNNSSRTYPLFANLRFSFTPRNPLLFADLRGGMALHSIDVVSGNKFKPYAQVGVGVYLARGKHFSSYLIAGYAWYSRSGITYTPEDFATTPQPEAAAAVADVTADADTEGGEPTPTEPVTPAAEPVMLKDLQCGFVRLGIRF
ncbi:MAG: hypothetical protein ACI30W_08525 [Muribaculaceae bacterium]